VKTGSMPFTLHGVPAADGTWSIDSDTPTELRMTQHRDDEPIARLEATRRTLSARHPRLAA